MRICAFAAGSEEMNDQAQTCVHEACEMLRWLDERFKGDGCFGIYLYFINIANSTMPKIIPSILGWIFNDPENFKRSDAGDIDFFLAKADKSETDLITCHERAFWENLRIRWFLLTHEERDIIWSRFANMMKEFRHTNYVSTM